MADPADPSTLIDRWQNAEASERAHAQLFLNELAAPLGVPRPSNSLSDGHSLGSPVRILH